MDHRELRILSLDFRRLSSNFLNSTCDTADVAMERFLNFIDTTPFIAKTIQDTIAGVECDFKVCFDFDCDSWRELKIPSDERVHVKAQYDYLRYIVDENDVNVLGQALQFYTSSNKYNDSIQSFVSNCFKSLIDYINDAISKEMIILEDGRHMAPNVTQTFNQNIGTVNGTANQQGSGTIQSTNFTNGASADLLALISKLSQSVDSFEEIPAEEKDSVKDDLESIEEQIKSDAPKKNRLQKALKGVKDFVTKFGDKIAIPVAVNALKEVDWSNVIQQVDMFIANLPN